MRRKRAVILTLASFILWQLVIYLGATVSCQKAAINDLCDSWQNGEVEGDWCFHLCAAKKSCHGVTHFGKELVVRLKGPFGKAVVKGRYSRGRDSANSELGLDPTNPGRDFEHRVAARISDFLKPHQIDPALNERIVSSATSDLQKHQFLQLMHQREFAWSFLYGQTQEASPFPRLRGTCGHLFIVEESDEQFKNVGHWPIRKKLAAIIKVIDLITVLEEQNVEVCDLKWEHFGLFYNQSTSPARDSMDFVIKLLDLDAVFSEQSLKMTLENYDCKTDEDCDFFDCKGRCVEGDDLRKPTCVSSSTDSNIKRFLKMVSASVFPPQRSLFLGVVDKALLEYVEHCSVSDCDLRQLRERLEEAIARLDPS